LKIAHLSRSLIQPAGTERSVMELARQMANQGVDVRIYTARYRENLFENVRSVQIEVIKSVTPPIFEYYHDLLLAKRLISEASKWADVLILHDGQSMASYAMRHFSVPCIPFYHNDRWDPNIWGLFRSIAPIYSRPLDALELKSLRELPLVFANSQSLAIAIREHASNAKVVPIIIGVDTSRFIPKWNEDDGFIMMSGRLHPINNFELGIKAIADTDHSMLVASILEKKNLWYYRGLQKIVSNDESLRNRVTFEFLTETALIDRIQRCSLFLSPRRFDYLGHAALEPMACGKPVVANDSCGRIEEDPPVVSCQNNPEQWREAVSVLMNDRKLREELGRRSYEFVQQKHSLKMSVAQILQYASHCTKEHGRVGVDFNASLMSQESAQFY
jgi:glycosyltransferase involved in cell wall biosynthesis